jgi:hypothetical protein
MREWVRSPDGELKQSASAYPIADGDAAATFLCSKSTRSNCAMNYEGLCLMPPRSGGPCAGFAVSKKKGELHCLVRHPEKRIQLDPSIRLKVSIPEALTGCHFDGEDLWIGTNMFAAGKVSQVQEWRDPARAQAKRVDLLGPGFPEAIAVKGGNVYRFSDTASSPSLMARYKCQVP